MEFGERRRCGTGGMAGARLAEITECPKKLARTDDWRVGAGAQWNGAQQYANATDMDAEAYA